MGGRCEVDARRVLRMSQSNSQPESSTLSVASLVIGIASLLMQWTFVVPIAGIAIGVLAKRREPHAQRLANWGIGLSAAMLLGALLLWILAGGLILAAIGLHGVSV